MFGSSIYLRVADFAVDHIAIIIPWRRGRRTTWRFRLRLALRVQLLAQRMEGLLDLFAQLFDTSGIVALKIILLAERPVKLAHSTLITLIYP